MDEQDSRVSLADEAAIRYWTARLGVSRDELEEAVETVGDSIAAVAAYLNIESRGSGG
jgi:hypothetical protein